MCHSYINTVHVYNFEQALYINVFLIENDCHNK